MGLFCCLFCCFPEGFYKIKHTFEKTNNTKENQTNLRENQQSNVFKGFRPTLGYGFVLFVCLVFPKVFTKPNKPSRKPRIQKKTKENQRKQKNLRENQNNKVVKGFRPTLGYISFLLFWFSLMFFLVL